MIINFLRGLFGDYKGQQRTIPLSPIVPDAKAADVNNLLQIPAIWQCVNKITRAMSSLPCEVFDVEQDGSLRRDTSSALSYMLGERPNSWQSPADFLEKITSDFLLFGNAFVKIARDVRARPVALIPLNPGQVRVWVEDAIRYEYSNADGEVETLAARDVIHWRGLGNGVVGMSMSDFARASVTEAAEIQQTNVEMFRNKGKMSGVLTSSSPLLDKKQMAQFLQAFSEMKNAKLGIPIIPWGFDFKQIQYSPAESKLLETREFIVKDFARWFGIPVGLLNGENPDLVELSNYFYETVILPMCIKLEQALKNKLVPARERKVIKFKFSVLRRANEEARSRVFATYVQNGIKTRDEIRADLNLEKSGQAGAETLTAQTNLAPLGGLGAFDPAKTAQDPLTEEPQKQ